MDFLKRLSQRNRKECSPAPHLERSTASRAISGIGEADMTSGDEGAGFYQYLAIPTYIRRGININVRL